MYIDQQVLGLQVSMQHAMGVAEMNALEHLIGVALDKIIDYIMLMLLIERCLKRCIVLKDIKGCLQGIIA